MDFLCHKSILLILVHDNLYSFLLSFLSLLLLVLIFLYDLPNFLNTLNALATTLVALDESDGLVNIQVDSKLIINYFSDFIRLLVAQGFGVRLHNILFLDFQGYFLWGLFLFGSFLLLLFLSLFGFLLLAASVYFLFPDDIEINAIFSVLEVTRNRNFNNRGIILQVKQKLVQMHVQRASTGVEFCQ